MISQVNSASLAYIPLSQAVKVESLPEAKILSSQPPRLVHYSNSIANNSPSFQSSLGATDSGSANSLDSAHDTIQQNAQVQQVINQLKARDSEVKAHEMAHLSAAGGYSAGGMSFTYQMGPDGRQYAIGGEVGIDVSAVSGDPQATLQKAMVVYSAALAPAEPSSQDRKVASAAMQMMAQARTDIMVQAQDERKVESEGQTEKDLGSEIDSENRPLEAGLVLESPFNSANRNGDVLQNGVLIQNLNASEPIKNPDRNQFDLRMQFSANSLLSPLR